LLIPATWINLPVVECKGAPGGRTGQNFWQNFLWSQLAQPLF